MHLVNPQTLVLGVTAMHLEAKTRARQVLERVQVHLAIRVVLDRQQTMHLETITQLATMVSVATTTHLLLERILQVLDRRQILVLETRMPPVLARKTRVLVHQMPRFWCFECQRFWSSNASGFGASNANGFGSSNTRKWIRWWWFPLVNVGIIAEKLSLIMSLTYQINMLYEISYGFFLL